MHFAGSSSVFLGRLQQCWEHRSVHSNFPCVLDKLSSHTTGPRSLWNLSWRTMGVYYSLCPAWRWRKGQELHTDSGCGFSDVGPPIGDGLHEHCLVSGPICRGLSYFPRQKFTTQKKYLSRIFHDIPHYGTGSMIETDQYFSPVAQTWAL